MAYKSKKAAVHDGFYYICLDRGDNFNSRNCLFSPNATGVYSDEFANASKLESDVKFYETSSPDVAKLFNIDPAAGNKALIFLNKTAEQKFTLYRPCLYLALNFPPLLGMYSITAPLCVMQCVYLVGGAFLAYDIAYFVTTAKKLDKARAQGTAPTIFGNAIKKQACNLVFNSISFLYFQYNLFLSMYSSLTEPLCVIFANRAWRTEDRPRTKARRTSMKS